MGCSPQQSGELNSQNSAAEPADYRLMRVGEPKKGEQTNDQPLGQGRECIDQKGHASADDSSFG